MCLLSLIVAVEILFAFCLAEQKLIQGAKSFNAQPWTTYVPLVTNLAKANPTVLWAALMILFIDLTGVCALHQSMVRLADVVLVESEKRFKRRRRKLKTRVSVRWGVIVIAWSAIPMSELEMIIWVLVAGFPGVLFSYFKKSEITQTTTSIEDRTIRVKRDAHNLDVTESLELGLNTSILSLIQVVQVPNWFNIQRINDSDWLTFAIAIVGATLFELTFTLVTNRFKRRVILKEFYMTIEGQNAVHKASFGVTSVVRSVVQSMAHVDSTTPSTEALQRRPALGGGPRVGSVASSVETPMSRQSTASGSTHNMLAHRQSSQSGSTHNMPIYRQSSLSGSTHMLGPPQQHEELLKVSASRLVTKLMAEEGVSSNRLPYVDKDSKSRRSSASSVDNGGRRIQSARPAEAYTAGDQATDNNDILSTFLGDDVDEEPIFNSERVDYRSNRLSVASAGPGHRRKMTLESTHGTIRSGQIARLKRGDTMRLGSISNLSQYSMDTLSYIMTSNNDLTSKPLQAINQRAPKTDKPPRSSRIQQVDLADDGDRASTHAGTVGVPESASANNLPPLQTFAALPPIATRAPHERPSSALPPTTETAASSAVLLPDQVDPESARPISDLWIRAATETIQEVMATYLSIITSAFICMLVAARDSLIGLPPTSDCYSPDAVLCSTVAIRLIIMLLCHFVMDCIVIGVGMRQGFSFERAAQVRPPLQMIAAVAMLLSGIAINTISAYRGQFSLLGVPGVKTCEPISWG
ncbi:hypothetical protein HK101_001291 [Irineochytrium annulatum]|nr:hypothetical protein HK101_001291 [Irineochytrium annulatum]